MATVQLLRAFDMTDIALVDYTDGQVHVVNNSEVDLTNGKYTGQLYGENLAFGSGTIHEFDVQRNGKALFSLTDMNVSESQLFSDRHNNAALIHDVFGGSDFVQGSIGSDGLAGFEGADVLKGGRGADTLVGGEGADRLVGGKDADTFTFTAVTDSTKAAMDVITDLSHGETIDISALGVTLDDISVVYKAHGDVTVFGVDTNGDGKGDLVFSALGDHSHAGDVTFVI